MTRSGADRSRRALRSTIRVGQSLLWIPTSYVAVLTVTGALPMRPESQPAETDSPISMAVLVPAHDEEATLPECLAAIERARPPRGRVEVIVIADNCTDRTAEVAAAAGVTVWVRRHSVRGKGATLRYAIDRLMARPHPPEAVAVVDADSLVDADFLDLAARRLAAGALVVQGVYRVRAPSQPSAVSRLLFTASACQSILRPRGRDRIGAAAKLQGNGMVFGRSVLQQVPWDAFGLAEDVDYWFRILRAGVHPVHQPAAGVAALMPEDIAGTRVQRTRWESGRRAVVREQLRPAILQALRKRDLVLLEAVLSELVFPPLAVHAAQIVGMGILSYVARQGAGDRRRALRTAGGQGAILAVHALVALRIAQADRRTYLALAAVPAVVAWKVAVKVRLTLRPETVWRRTPRTDDA